MDLKKILPIAIIVVAVLAVVVYAAFRPAADTGLPPAAGTSQSSGLSGANGSGGQVPSQMPSTQGQTQQAAPNAASPSVPADGKPVSSAIPATLVPANETLNQFCEKYYKAWMAKDWKTAYDLQPVSKKAAKPAQTDIDSFGQSRESYGLSGYQVGTPQVNGNVATVDVTMDLGANGQWATVWTFVKNDKGQWTAQDSKVSIGGTGGAGQ